MDKEGHGRLSRIMYMSDSNSCVFVGGCRCMYVET